jgi:hypothetical protein
MRADKVTSYSERKRFGNAEELFRNANDEVRVGDSDSYPRLK